MLSFGLPFLSHSSYAPCYTRCFLVRPGGVQLERSSPLAWLCKWCLDPSCSGGILVHRESFCFAIVAVVKLRQRGVGPSKYGSARRST